MNSVRREGWFEVIPLKEHLVVIREKLSEIEPRYHTHYSNLYLLLGSVSALLIDTGSGLCPLRSLVEELIEERNLLVVNTHAHFDHIGGNGEFEEIYIHESESTRAKHPLDVSFLKDSPAKTASNYEDRNYLLPPATHVNMLKDEKVFHLGGLDVTTLHAPGHSLGSTCLYTDEGEFFTGDAAHYGAVFLPPRPHLLTVLGSLSRMIRACEEKLLTELFPSHETYQVNPDLLSKMLRDLGNIERVWGNREPDEFNHSWKILRDEFTYLIEVDAREQEGFKLRLNSS